MQEKVERLASVLNELFSEYDLSPKDVLRALERREEEHIPLQCFSSKKLSSLEIVVKYLKENRGKKFSEIAKLLNRDDRTIWCTYSSSQKKQKSLLEISGAIYVPIRVFTDRKSGPLACLVRYLKDELGFTFKKIAQSLGKDYQTIYTSYKRVMSR